MSLKATALALYASIAAASASADSIGASPAFPAPTAAPSFSQKLHEILTKEALAAGVPARLVEAVIKIESGFDPNARGTVGEIGLMQVRPGTAALLGFRGTTGELAQPDINVHFGTTYLGEAWRLTDGNLCRTLMKYRAGLGEEVYTQRSIDYCNKARLYLTSQGWPADISAPTGQATASPHHMRVSDSPTRAYAKFKHGTEAASRAFWQIQMKRISVLRAQVHAKWHRLASR